MQNLVTFPQGVSFPRICSCTIWRHHIVHEDWV